ncbi:hypothetical protein PVAND_001550 [Polypedilum vanderplanki]|uniref:DNA-directed RNA polymerase I subunit RPA49 n=1 Tax=Polypedilum vanderplanki TaxID=319348 RepID=A0A9J6BPL0_POLVA|nr:hypothetical protein PVAND_001550 [Polypedilum vanderplanki]
MEGLINSKIVSVDKINSKKASPILATFQNSSLSDDKCNQVVCKRVETESDGRKFALIATNSSVYKAELNDSKYEDTYLAIHNKTTGEINLIQVQKADFRNVLYDNKRSIYENNVVDKRKLYKEFGGKKAMASFDRQNQSQTQNSSILENTVDKVLQNVDIDKILDSSTLENEKEFSIFPEIKEDIEGKDVREIFTLDILFGAEIVEHMNEIALEALASPIDQLDFKNNHLKKTAASLQLSKQPEKNVNEMIMLLYAKILMKLINFRQKYFEISRELKNVSPRLQQNILSIFFINGSNEYSNYTKQKATVFYIILMLLTTKSLTIDLYDLLDGVVMSKREIFKYASIIGCKKSNGEKLSLTKVAKLDKNFKFTVPTLKGKKDRSK